MPASPELTGGAGFTYEDAVTAYYLTALLAERPAMGLHDGYVERIELQRGALGEPLDDIIVRGRLAGGESVLGLQVKRSFAVNSRKSNTDFRETVARGWKTLTDPTRTQLQIRIGVATADVDGSQLRHVQTLGEWARQSADAADFLRKVAVPGLAGEGKRLATDAVRTALGVALDRVATDDEVHRFFKAFVLIRLDLLGDVANDVQTARDRISATLRNPSVDAEAEVWRELRVAAREASGAAGSFTRHTLIDRLGRPERFAEAPSYRDDIARLAAESARALESIEQSIDGLIVPRDGLVARVDAALSRDRVVQITGQPGVGKSVLLRAFAQTRRGEAALLVLKADRLTEGGWAGYANRLGIAAADLRPLLRELASTSEPILLIDGLDRVRRAHRDLVVEFLEAVLGDPTLARWQVAITLRDGGWEYVGRWVPRLRQQPHIRIDVGNLDDDEANVVAGSHPRLHDLLFGDATVKEIARRPFFLNVLASAIDLERERPSSETELLAAWWNGGGYDAEGPERTRRQRVLIQLGRSTAGTLGREGPSAALDAEAVESLKADYILQDVEPGHTVSFRHDIYFEWAFVHDLIEAGAVWTDRLVEAGEPPALGRPVELLSQRRFEQNQGWRDELDRLDASGHRTQWRRSWILAPPSSPRFVDLHDRFSDAILIEDQGVRLRELLVWFQAVRTEPSDNLVRLPGVEALSEAERMRLADMLAAPTDYASWRRLLAWLIANGQRLPSSVWPHSLALMEVWQTAATRHRNTFSTGLLALAETWLHQLEDYRFPAEDTQRFDRFADLDYEAESALRKGLRTLLLGAAAAYPEIGDRYLRRIFEAPRMDREVWAEILTAAPYLAKTSAALLTDTFLKEVCGPLPRAKLERELRDEERRRAEAGSFPEGSHERDLLMPMGLAGHIDSWEWDRLSLDREGQHFSPPSPVREPFNSLFQYAPEEGLRLVHALANHAVMSWRELNVLDPEHGRKPIPLTLTFPWGVETYWGSAREYFAYRGAFAPPVLASGLMALEGWAFARLEAGDDLDAVLEDVLKGGSHNALIGIAAALALETLRVSAVVLPFAANPRLWRWDLERMVRIDSGQPANEIGAFDRRHLVALRRGNQRVARGRWLRQMAPLFALSDDEGLRGAFATALAGFPSNPPLDFEEQREDATVLADWARDSTRWAALGEATSYDIEPVSEGTIIREKPPEITDADEIAEIVEHGATMRWIALANAVRPMLNGGTVQITEHLLSEARALDEPTLFSGETGAPDLHVLCQSGVAGVATAVLTTEASSQADLDWAVEVILRAAGTPLANDGMTFEDSVLGDHPLLHVPRGLAAMIRRGVEPIKAASILLSFSAHYIREIGGIAFRMLIGLGDAEPELARAALQFVVDLSIRSDTPRLRHQTGNLANEARARDVDAAWERAVSVAEGRSTLTFRDFPLPPHVADAGRDDDEWREIWNEPSFFDTHWLEPLLPALAGAVATGPLAPEVMDLGDRLFAWTVARARPDAEELRRSHARTSEWRGTLGTWLATLAVDVEGPTLIARFVDPIVGLPDPLFAQIAGPFVGHFAGVKVHDAPILTPETVEVLTIFARRSTTMRLSRRGEDDAERLLADLMGLPMLRADLANRFANGDWSDFSKMLPIVQVLFDAFLARSSFVSQWLRLVEAAGDHYPVDVFAEQLDRAISARKPGSIGPDLSSRTAGLVQTHAEARDSLSGTERLHFLRVLDILIDSGSRRAAALQRSEIFRGHLRT
ncbi:hypothetical protein D3C71_181960 [compost metagenome]